jgi:trans-2,3-dihydro-3-hydroxyanthranilate isomerase
MKQIQVYHVDAFTTKPFEGNPAGVVPDASHLTATQIQKIANQLNLPETAFLLPATDPRADFRVRYFTPQEEIPFCGHATVASVWLLANEYGWAERTDTITLETNVGLIPVHWEQSENKVGKVTMTQISPQVKDAPFHDKLEMANLIGVDMDQLDERYPVKLAYTGNWTLIVPVKTHQAIDKAKPRMDQLAEFNRRYSISNTHLFTFDAKQGFDLYTRDFAPTIGIPEDPVTGAANGALAGYLVLERIISKEKTRLTIGQGDAMGRPGKLYVTIQSIDQDIVIQVGGYKYVTLEGVLRLPQS